jgi:hypothetical protein
MGSKHKIGFLSIAISLNKKISHFHHALLSVLLRQFLPDNYEKYAAAQFRMTTAYQQYYSWVPEFLHQRPRPVIAHSLQRIKNCEKEKYTETDIQTLDDGQGIFSVQSKSGHIVAVHVGAPSCTCQDWLTYHLPCKHFYAVFKFKTEWSWDKLPKEYVNSHRLSFDKDVLQSALVPDESAHTTEQISLLDYAETGLEDTFSGSEPTKQVRYNTMYIRVHVHAQFM